MTPERLRSLVSYDPDTGECRWLVKRTKNGVANVGDLAGGIDDHGYRRIMIDGKKYRLHRLAFVYMGCEIPEFVDHINGNRSDNRWSNLRAATCEINAKNAKKRRDGILCPVTGVGWMKSHSKWRVRCNHNGRSVFLGTFESLDEAIAARSAANVRYGYSETHGRRA